MFLHQRAQQLRVSIKDAQYKELKDRQDEREKRAEERFQAAVTGLGDDKAETRVGADGVSVDIRYLSFPLPGFSRAREALGKHTLEVRSVT